MNDAISGLNRQLSRSAAGSNERCHGEVHVKRLM